jgi:hypothetical protein
MHFESWATRMGIGEVAVAEVRRLLFDAPPYRGSVCAHASKARQRISTSLSAFIARKE